MNISWLAAKCKHELVRETNKQRMAWQRFGACMRNALAGACVLCKFMHANARTHHAVLDKDDNLLGYFNNPFYNRKINAGYG